MKKNTRFTQNTLLRINSQGVRCRNANSDWRIGYPSSYSTFTNTLIPSGNVWINLPTTYGQIIRQIGSYNLGWPPVNSEFKTESDPHYVLWFSTWKPNERMMRMKTLSRFLLSSGSAISGPRLLEQSREWWWHEIHSRVSPPLPGGTDLINSPLLSRPIINSWSLGVHYKLTAWAFSHCPKSWDKDSERGVININIIIP